jgi:hypothetical protein
MAARSVILKSRGMEQGQPPPAPEYSADGVDLSLIRWMLSLTPRERLAFHEERINDILSVLELNGRT